MGKKYFWLKLKTNFFKTKEMKKLRQIAGGDTFTIIYLKMQLLSIDHDGVIYFESIEDNFAEELALELDEAEENVKLTLMFLEKHGLIEQISDESYLLPKVVESIGSETDSAERMRRLRGKNKELPSHCDTTVRKSNTEKEKDIEKEIDIQQTAAVVYSTYQSEIGVLSSLIHERLDYWLQEFNQSIVVHAIQLAAESNVRRWAYIDSILKSWSDKSVNTLDDVKALQADYKRKSSKPTRVSKPKIEVAESTEPTVTDDDYQAILKKHGMYYEFHPEVEDA